MCNALVAFAFPSGRTAKRLSTVLALASLLFAHGARAAYEGAAPQSESAELLTPGTPLRRKISNQESHSYSLTLDAGQYARFEVEQWDINIGVSLYDPSGRKITGFSCRRRGAAPLSVIADISGNYRIEIRPYEDPGASGSYSIESEPIREAAPADKNRLAADRAFVQGSRLFEEGSLDSRQKSLKQYNEALNFWNLADDKTKQAYALKTIGEVYQSLNDPNQALAKYELAARLAGESTSLRLEGEINNATGYAYFHLGDKAKALTFYQKALKTSREAGDLKGEILALNNIGEIHYSSGAMQESLDTYQQALDLNEKAGDRWGLALTLLNFGYTYSDMIRPPEAFEAYNKALKLWISMDDRQYQALTLIAQGHLYNKLGEKQDALNLYDKARPLTQFTGDKATEAAILAGYGYIYDGYGDTRRALQYLENALDLFRKANHLNGQAGTLYMVGTSYLSLREYAKALDYFNRSLETSRALNHQRSAARALKYLGKTYYSMGDVGRALEYYNEALALNRLGGDKRTEAVTSNEIGDVYFTLNDKERAVDYYKKALPLARDSMDPLTEISILFNIARVESGRGNIKEAGALLEDVIGKIEAQRAKVLLPSLRSSYFAISQQACELYINMLMRQHREKPAEGYDILAFQMSERMRDRNLVESLLTVQSDADREADPVLLKREEHLRQLLSDIVDRQSRLQEPGNSQQANIIASKIDRVSMEYEEVQSQIRASSRRYIVLRQPQPVRLREVQGLLDADTLLLEYSLGIERSFLWVVGPDSVSSFELPPRSEIEGAVSRFLDSMVEISSGGSDARKRMGAGEAEAEYVKSGKLLSRMVLGPAASLLGSKRLLIAADGRLQSVPFTALPALEGTGGPADEGKDITPLMVEHEIVGISSATALLVLRERLKARQPAPRVLAVLADPVFEKDDPRFFLSRKGQAARGLVARDRGPDRIVGLIGKGRRNGLARLNYSGREAEAALSYVPAGERMLALGFDANKALATSSELGKFRLIHFATHGLYNEKHPELSGIMLSMFDESRRSQNGFLQLHEVYNLKLPADLVVLSACQTGVGKEVRGEGAIGLSRGFIHAGAARVMGSLWKVDDEATMELMNLFYKKMFASSQTPAAALREAQIEMWKDRRWRSPYYWAGFVLQGEWK